MTYRCHACSAETEYNIKIVSVPHAATKSETSIIHFLSQRSTIAPAKKRKSIVGKKVQIVSIVTLDADGNSKITDDLNGAITYILKKNRYYFQKKLDSGGNSTSYYAHFKREDIKWYMPASGQFIYFDPNPNIENDIPYTYGSSTAVDGEDYAFRGDGSQEDRVKELRVIAVRKDETGVVTTTATVDNTSLTGGENGSANNWLE